VIAEWAVWRQLCFNAIADGLAGVSGEEEKGK